MTTLQTLLDDIAFDALPFEWATFDFAMFSQSKRLWDYQQTALQNALKALWMYYDGEKDEAQRKARCFAWYKANDVALDADLPLGKKRDNAALLERYYPLETTGAGKGGQDARIDYQHFINRMGFWMATGSGKTLVVVKLLELLWTLMQRGLIPARDVMVLTHREDLLQQLRDHVDDFNRAGKTPYLRLRELRDYPEVKRGLTSLYAEQELTVFTYRSDNLSDEQKERIVDFRNYDNNGQWYLLLDEAHKGDKEDSKRQHIYNILSRAGFLFNFSATFTDPRDILTTASEFNLASFIQGGYGKHISLLTQENRAFKDKEDFTNAEKQRIVLQALLMLTYVSKARDKLCAAVQDTLYHPPLLLALVNSVNTEDADLKLFFRELVRIGHGITQEGITQEAFGAAKAALKQELAPPPEWFYEQPGFKLLPSLYDMLSMQDVLRHVFNAEQGGALEVLVRPSNNKELAFKLKSAADPFALIKIGDVSGWLKSELADQELVKGFADESFFARLNEDDSTIRLLLGSRSFYEGWDSNRPNVITFVNIGVGSEARKFALQAVGRGVRIEPRKGKRRRLANLYNAGAVDATTFDQAKPFLSAVESLFIFGANRPALATIFAGLEQEKSPAAGSELALEINQAALSADHPVLIPTYRRLDGQLLMKQRTPRKFEISETERQRLAAYVEHLGDNRLLLARHNLPPQQIGMLRSALAAPDAYFVDNGTRRYGSFDILLPRLANYFALVPQEVQGFKPLTDEINHFKHIQVRLENIDALRQKVTAVQAYQDPSEQRAALKERYLQGALDIDAYTTAIEAVVAHTKDEDTFSPPTGPSLTIKHIAAHYYLPILLSDDEKNNYFSHVLRVPSEVRFVQQLADYIKEPGNLFKRCDWWLFSRTDETTDKVILPYYDPLQNRIRDFHPDFVFWLVRGNEYTILLVDPKGMMASSYQHKIEDYRRLFRDDDGGYRIFTHGRYRVRVALAMYNKDASAAPDPFREYWHDHVRGMLAGLMEPVEVSG